MTIEKAKSTDTVNSGLVAGTKSGESAVALGRFDFECIGEEVIFIKNNNSTNLIIYSIFYFG